jgi:hypothetical protein
VSVYKRGEVWWYKFRFGGQMIRESSKSPSKTVAKDERANLKHLSPFFGKLLLCDITGQDIAEAYP